jgi:hypothetical protein
MVILALAAALLAAPRPATVVHETVWFRGGRPAPGLQITLDIAGYCVSGARSTARADAWRCFADHWIDPCFSATPRSRTVLCPVDPWSKQVRLVELTRRLPPVRTRASRKYAPWGVWTANGKRCVIAVSANLRFDGQRVRYECAVSGFLLGFANTQGREWTIGYLPRFALANPRRLHARRIGITDVWR